MLIANCHVPGPSTATVVPPLTESWPGCSLAAGELKTLKKQSFIELHIDAGSHPDAAELLHQPGGSLHLPPLQGLRPHLSRHAALISSKEALIASSKEALTKL